jgi:hypothetical protein
MSEIKINNIPVITENNGSVSLTTGSVITDTISESTAGSGVTIDGLKIKDTGIQVGGLEGINIDSSGRVTMPYRPAFMAHANEGGNEYFAGGSIPSFSNITLNTGNHFNGSRFTAPIAGQYVFSFSIMGGSSGGFGLIQFIKNGSSIVAGVNWTQIYVASNNDRTANATKIISLNAGDYVELQINNSYNHFYWTANYSSYCGYFLG